MNHSTAEGMGLQKNATFFCIITQNISGVSNHTALPSDLYVQVLLYLGDL